MEYSTDSADKATTQFAANSSNEKVVQNKTRELKDNRPASILQRKENNTGLPDNLKSGIENLSGHSMDDVKVHYNSDKPAKLNALAYAQGSDIHIASGQEKHLPHEAWHVVQQKQGRVKPTLQMKGKVNVNDDKGLESEADVMGSKALQLYCKPSVVELKSNSISKNISQRVIQCAKPGEAAPTLKSQLTRRYKQMSNESKITDSIIQRMLVLMNASVVLPAEITLPDPLAPVPPGMAANIVTIALHQQLQLDNSAVNNINLFKHNVINLGIIKASNLNIIDSFMQEIEAIIDPYYHQAEHDVYTNPATNSNPELATAVGNVAVGPNLLSRAAHTHLANPRPQIRELSMLEQTQLKQNLLKMPVVISMLNGKFENSKDNASGSHLLNGIDFTGSATITEKLINRIQQALGVLGHLVDSHVLPPRSKVPNIEVNPDPVKQIPQSILDKIRGIQQTIVEPFRANANRDENRVRISALTELDIIVHEFGHQIEFFLPADQWLDIQDLLRMRHRGNKLISIYPDSENQSEREEASLNAKMPATGTYSAKVYDDGSTEVMSMTLEYFSTPEKARIMIDKDPLQAAIILRIIKPTEFNNHIPHNLRALLPRGDISPGAHPVISQPPTQPVGLEIGDNDL